MKKIDVVKYRELYAKATEILKRLGAPDTRIDGPGPSTNCVQVIWSPGVGLVLSRSSSESTWDWNHSRIADSLLIDGAKCLPDLVDKAARAKEGEGTQDNTEFVLLVRRLQTHTINSDWGTQVGDKVTWMTPVGSYVVPDGMEQYARKLVDNIRNYPVVKAEVATVGGVHTVPFLRKEVEKWTVAALPLGDAPHEAPVRLRKKPGPKPKIK